MVNNYAKMRRSNSKVREWLVEKGYENITFFPHTRWFKDIHIDDFKFDGIATKNSRIILFQVKSNKNPSKKILKGYNKLVREYCVNCIWFNVVDRKDMIIYKQK